MRHEELPPGVFLRTYGAPILAGATVPDILRLTRGLGCTCRPDIIRRDPGWRIEHDDWCQLVETNRGADF